MSTYLRSEAREVERVKRIQEAKSSPKQINIYLSDVDKTEMNKKAIESSENMSQQYIILSHDKMRIDRDLLNDELAELRRKYDELEDDNDQMEKTIINLKGFVKNIGEMNKLNSQINNTYSKFQTESRNLIIDNYNIIYKLIRTTAVSIGVIFIVYIILLFMNYVTMSDIGILVALYGTLALFIVPSFYNKCPYVKDIRYVLKIKDTDYHIIHHKYHHIICDKMMELTKIENGNAFLNDLIDMQ
jgi:hypothetical protein